MYNTAVSESPKSFKVLKLLRSQSKKCMVVAAVSAASFVSTSAMAADDLTLCIFDPMGTRGDAYAFAQDYVLQMPKFGITKKVNLKVYTNEAVVAEDFRVGKCDGAAMSNLRARNFNKFTGSLDAIGAVPDYKHLNVVFKLLSKPKFAKYMQSQKGPYEVVGLIPLGAAYVMVNDRSIDSLEKAAGKKIAVLDFDKSQAKMIEQIGGQPVSVDFSTIAGKFNNGQVDIMAGPAVIFKPLELHKGMTDSSGKVTGAIINYPLLQVTAALMVNTSKGKFDNPAANQKIREYVVSQLGTAYKYVEKEEKGVPQKYWMDIKAADKPTYQKLMREARVQMTQDGHYHPVMMKLLKKVRCKFNPSNYECALNDE